MRHVLADKLPLSYIETTTKKYSTEKFSVLYLFSIFFTVTARVEIGDQFFGWLLGFGKKALLVSPPVRQRSLMFIKVKDIDFDNNFKGLGNLKNKEALERTSFLF